MDFFNSLTLDLKVLVIGVAGCALLAIFSGNRNTERLYLCVLAVLAAAGVYRFMHIPSDDRSDLAAAAMSRQHLVIAPDKHIPLISTSAK
jgi:hypothetical protein